MYELKKQKKKKKEKVIKKLTCQKYYEPKMEALSSFWESTNILPCDGILFKIE